MFPLQALDLALSQARQLPFHVPLLAGLVVAQHPEQRHRRYDEDQARRRQVEAVADGVVRPVRRQVRPGGDEPADAAEHHVDGEGDGAGRVADDLGRRLRVGQRPRREAARRVQERRRVPGLRVRRPEEHGVAHHDEGRREDEEDLPPVEAPAEQGEQDLEEGADHVGRHRRELLLDRRPLRVDRVDDGRREQREPLHRDVVEEEDEGRRYDDRVPEPEPELAPVHRVEDFGLPDPLRLDALDGEDALLGRQPARRLGAVGQGQEGEQ